MSKPTDHRPYPFIEDRTSQLLVLGVALRLSIGIFTFQKIQIGGEGRGVQSRTGRKEMADTELQAEVHSVEDLLNEIDSEALYRGSASERAGSPQDDGLCPRPDA